MSKKIHTGHEKGWFDSKLIKWIMPSLERHRKKKLDQDPNPTPAVLYALGLLYTAAKSLCE